MFSVQCLLLGLHGYLIHFATLAFIPHCQNCSCRMPSPIVSPVEINVFYHYLNCTFCISQTRVLQYLLHALPLRDRISQETYKTSYGCFRPNKCGCDLDCWDYRGGWHQSCPVLILLPFYIRQKFFQMEKHSGSLCHACAHCKKSPPAAPRRARTSVSESFLGLPR